MRYLVAYDIADPGRLRRVAKTMERAAIRCQKSVFVLEATPEQVQQLLDRLVPLLDLSADVVQAWRLSGTERTTGQVRGLALPADAVCAIGSTESQHFISGDLR